MRFEVLTAVSTKMAVFWVIALCSLVEALMMDATKTYETLVNFYQTTRRYNPEDSHLHVNVGLLGCNTV
jgi:phage-related holin